MDFKKLSPPQQQPIEQQATSLSHSIHLVPNEQIPNRSSSNTRLQLIPPVTTNRQDTDELTKNIGSDYQDIQIRTLTKWINVQLEKIGESPIQHIEQDLKDGKKLLKLLSIVSSNTHFKPEKGNMRIHQLSNVAQALKFLQDQWGSDSLLPAVASEAIVNGDVKSTLAITFFIMLKYQIHPILLSNNNQLQVVAPPPIPLPTVSVSRGNNTSTTNGKSLLAEAKLALLYWVRSQLQDYVQHAIISTVQDFSRSWRSGLAFCLLIHRHDPTLIPSLFQQEEGLVLSAKEKSTWYKLLTLAFDVAEQEMHIPKYLEPADLLDVEYPHEPSVMMYVAEMYKVMSSVTSLDNDSQQEKRLKDILLVANTNTTPPPPPPTTIEKEKEKEKKYDIITPPDSTIVIEEGETPNTPQPELLFDQEDGEEEEEEEEEEEDVYQQLDALSSLLANTPQEKNQQQYEKLLRNANQIISKLDPSSSEKQFLSSRYNQLRSEWEILSKKLKVVQHSSNYVNESDGPILTLLKQLATIQQQHHPLDGGDETMSEEWTRQLSYIATLMEADHVQDQVILDKFNSTQAALQLFKRGLTFTQITNAIQDELQVIQQLMSNSGVSKAVVTDDLIQSLEQRIHVVNATIQGVREEYNPDLILYDTGNDYFDRFIICIDNLEDKYELVRDWVDQVRVWFVEAERIRTWIDKHIQIIQQRNEQDTFNPVARDIAIEDNLVIQLHEQHERLKQEIDHFDSDDMNRLRAHVKMLTNATTQEESAVKELTPADTSTIEITLTTLTMLNQLTQMLNKRSHLIQLLLLRVKWEDLFGNAVQWIAETDGELDTFLRGKARWSPEKEDSSSSAKFNNNNNAEEEEEEEEHGEEGIEGVIKTLVSLERKIADFDQGQYSEVLESYQEMETLESLPDYLEVRQLGFEKAFEDLMKRSGFSRKVVEQLLFMMNTLDKFKELRDVGEKLRLHLQNSQIVEDDVYYAEQVQTFKEDSARLITNASTSIPYPAVPEMSTAIGANDAHDNQITNENIKSTISNYSMSLALIADGLDQLLMSRYQLLSLQQRASEAHDQMNKVKSWMEERCKLLQKSRFDLMLYTNQQKKYFTSPNSSSNTSSSSSNNNNNKDETIMNGNTKQSNSNGTTNNNSSTTTTTTTTMPALDDETLARLEKERDGIALRLHQMENDDLGKLFDLVRALEYDVDALNAVSIDRNDLINNVESLESTHQQLKSLLVQRGLELDALKKRIDWENQWSKCNSHLQTVARKLCDFNVKKARYDPAKENTEKPSYNHDQDNLQSLQFIQDRVIELGDRHLAALFECYQEMVDSYGCLQNNSNSNSNSDSNNQQQQSALNTVVPDFLATKQSDLKLEYDDLRHLSSYTSDLMTQRATITEFLMRAQDAHHEGEKIKDVVSKRTRRIMVQQDEEESNLDARVGAFKQEVKSIWQECGEKMSYPVYNGNWLKSSSVSSLADGAARAQVRASIKALLDKKMEELATLEKSIDTLLQVYHEADRMKTLVAQYEQEACQLGQWIDQQIEQLRQQHIDVSAESFLARDMNISDLKKSRLVLFLQVEKFESNKFKTLHDQIAQLVEDSVEKKKNKSVDVSSAARHLGKVMNDLSLLKRGLSDQAVTLEAASMRAEWEKNLQLGITKLEDMNEQLRQFTTKKNQWFAQDDLDEYHVQTLQQDLAKLVSQKTKFEKSIMPGIQLSYDAFVEYFPKLSRPMATPDHLEARMESLGRTATRFQENVVARSKELDIIKQRIRWEDTVKQALAYLAEKEILIEAFIEDKARWRQGNATTSVDDDNAEVKLRTELSNMYFDVESYKESVIIPLQKRFDNLVNENTDHYNNTSVTLLPSAFMKKMQDIQSAQERTHYYLQFSNEVVTQRCLVSAFILRTAQLEQSAELIREEFIASTATKVSQHMIANVLEMHTDRLEKFKAGIEDVKQNLATSIPYPVRGGPVKDANNKAIKDETTNTVIQETVEMRNTKLDEIYSSLEQLLQSKERVSRRRLSLHSYKKQAQVVEAWMDARRDILALVAIVDDIEKLKEAVSQADGVEQAMMANESVYTTLKSTFDKCMAAFEDKSLDDDSEEGDDEALAKEIVDIVQPTQHRITQAWNDLLNQVSKARKSRTALLIESKIQQWLTALDDLAACVQSTTEDEQLALWTDELDKLEHQEYQSLMVDVQANKDVIDQEKMDTLFMTGLDTIETVRNRLSDLQNELFLGQLIAKYLEDISQLQNLVQAQINQLNKTNELYMRIDGDSTSDARSTQHQNLVVEYKQASDHINDLKDTYDDVSTQYNTILAKNGKYDDETHEVVSEKWNLLLSLESLVSSLVSRSSKWVKYFNSLTSIRQELKSIESILGTVPIMAESEKDVQYKQLDVKLREIDSSLKGELSQLIDDLVEDVINSKPFEDNHAACLEWKSKLKLNLDQQMTEREKLALIAAIKAIVDRLCDKCNAQLTIADQHCKSVDFIQDNTVDAVQVSINACNDYIKSSKSAQSNIQNELEALRMSQCNELVTKLGSTEEEVTTLITPLNSLLNKLEITARSEKECLSLANLLSQYLASGNSLNSTLDIFVSRLGKDQEVTEEVVSDLEGQLESLDDNKKELHVRGQEITQFNYKDLLLSESRISNVSTTIQASEKKINEKYNAFVTMLQQSRLDIEKINKRQQVIAKLIDLISFVGDMSDRVNALQLSVGSKREERELEDLCQEFYSALAKKQKVSDNLLATSEDANTDEEIGQLREQLASDIAALNALINIKKKEASDEGDLSEFLGIIAEFDEQIALLSSAMDNASPHHSSIVNGKFVKADLQALLRSLVTAYKQHQQIIMAILERARQESKKQFLGDNERVAEGIDKATKRWKQVQAAAAARERELQTCIGQLDHEFFTKLAIAKTTKKPSYRQQVYGLPPPLPTSSLSSSLNNATKRPPLNGRYFGSVNPVPRRSFDETNARRGPSKTPMSASSSTSRISRASYVPDPRSQLDVELGRIVNACPYRVKVKSVPDQVGKYWFGEENPRLVYCRILPSQLVMVRVGGGWVELSKFLREHGLTEGVYSRPEPSNDSSNRFDNTPFQESYLQTLRSLSPSGRVTIRGGNGGNSSSLASTRSSSKSSGSRSRSPLPGFVDGDKFISVDEAGNHLIVKMKKASEDAKTPIINKKKQQH